MVTISKRRFKMDIEDKIFEARELSAAYLFDAIQNPENDTIEAALEDSMDLTDEDNKLFGKDTKEAIYLEIVKFTFKEVINSKDVKKIQKAFSLTDDELNALSKDTKIQLNGLLSRRNKPPNQGKD